MKKLIKKMDILSRRYPCFVDFWTSITFGSLILVTLTIDIYLSIRLMNY